ncbi:uncharacterized protein LOC119667242 [Teleopsis dalmanni]|uniref:uncharacterized protein LOC119667242 n=1 Tax=Teleopsis dalmanni TaxID=139649 RepID=UPI0018CCED83|nr:uncharacterized protein LOC119667242 [Teleopsis dalmanni]
MKTKLACPCLKEFDGMQNRTYVSHRILLVVTFIIFLQWTVCYSQAPVEHLVPPPLPVPQRLTHANVPAFNPNKTHPIQSQTAIVNDSSQSVEQSGFMNRVARWFGYGPDAVIREQQLTSSSQQQPQYAHRNLASKQSYYYPKPNPAAPNEDIKCNLCNKYPWVPMLAPSVQYPLIHTPGQNVPHVPWVQNLQNLDAQATQKHVFKQQLPNHSIFNGILQQHVQSQQSPPVKQRAVQFNFPISNFYQYHQPSHQNPAPILHSIKSVQNVKLPAIPSFQPIPIPNLSEAAQPPIYNAQNFKLSHPTIPSHLTTQSLPTTEIAHFSENIGAHSELQPDTIIPTQVPPSTNADDVGFEIIKSHQITDFVSSVEYPATFVQSHAIDVGLEESANSKHTTTTPIKILNYQNQYLDTRLNNHLPGSQILTDLGGFSESQANQNSDFATQSYEQTTTTSIPRTTQFLEQLANAHNQHVQHTQDVKTADNYPSASSHNLTTILQSNNLVEWQVQPDELFYRTTPAPSIPTEVFTESILKTETPENEYFQKQQQRGRVFLQQKEHEEPIFLNRDRLTPKRLLNAPIQYPQLGNNPPRPFTRDPSDLNFRLGSINQASNEFHYPNHAYALGTSTAAPPLVVSAAAPTPTSTYSAIDASGHYAGMSPPPPRPAATKTNVHQIVIPYTTKNRPRPFQPVRTVESTSPISPWRNGVDYHEQQESQVVSSATEIPETTRRSNKYLTKILASNLRELLKREHDTKNKSHSNGFDLRKLQKNIDDWTEQEYTSLSHRPSTPTIRGRSKHIPTEYLTTTTPTPKQTKTATQFNSGELTSSINNLEPLAIDQGSRRYKPIDDNSLADFYDSEVLISTKSSKFKHFTQTSWTTMAVSTIPETSTATIPIHLHTYQNKEPKELWQKGKISISPQTNEKVYVVTPQPRFFPQRFVTTSETPEVNEPESVNISKKPRFLVRPTPGDHTSIGGSQRTTNVTHAFHSPTELFGLMGLSAFVSSEPVEIIDGNSKVNHSQRK